jgi:hypothetical protein
MIVFIDQSVVAPVGVETSRRFHQRAGTSGTIEIAKAKRRQNNGVINEKAA